MSGFSKSYLKKAIESMIFVSDKPVSPGNILNVFPDMQKAELSGILSELKAEWEELGRGFHLVEVSGGYQFRTRSDLSEVLLRFLRAKPYRLSRQALEVLAIIAYREPVTKVEIDRIRGVDSSGIIASLLEREIIEIRGREELPGRPFLYGTTDRFLEVFGLKSLGDLPPIKELEELLGGKT
jgi:segregation and condensation protein B